MIGRRPPSVQDVAALAGVSRSTVSNVLNRPEAVSDPTRAKVQDAIRKLGWVRNEAARNLRAGRNRFVGVVVKDIANPFFTDLVRGIEDVMFEAGYSVVLSDSASRHDLENRYLNLLGQQRVSGIILTPAATEVRLHKLHRFGIPVVIADRAGPSDDVCTVSVDEFAGGRLAANHLLVQGHRHLAFAGGGRDVRQVRDRLEGATLEVRLTSQAHIDTIPTDGFDISAGREVAARILAIPLAERPTAVFAANDMVAIGLLQGLVTNGLSIPHDIALIGYDDIDFAAGAAIPLSSVRKPRTKLARRSAELLLDHINAQNGTRTHQHRHVQLMPTLAARNSTLL